jgi:hypothetical protein
VTRALLVAVLLVACLLASCDRPPTPEPTPVGTGRFCTFSGTGATLAFEGKRLNFACGREGGNELGLLGDLLAGPQGWEIEMGVISHGDAGFALESSEVVVVLEIELSDGMHCPFAGTGASLAFEGKRLNFACPREGDKEVGLLGDVVPTRRGWEIERATIAHTDEAFVLQSSEMVPIAALIVAAGMP